MAVDPKSLTIDVRKLMRLSVSDRNQMIRHSSFRDVILNSLTPYQIAMMFPQYYKEMVGVSSGGSSPGLNLSKALSGMTPTEGVKGGGTAQPSVPSAPSTATQKPPVKGPEAPAESYGWYKRFMALKPETKTELQGTKQIGPPLPPELKTGPGEISIDAKGNVNKQQFYQAAVQKFRSSPLNGFVPQDGQRYGIDGTPESWARFAMRTAKVESGFNVNTTNPRDPGGSYGLFQWGYHYGINKDNWRDPNSQLDAFVNYANTWTVNGGGYILPPPGVQAKRSGRYGGFGAVFSTVRDDKVNSRDAIATANSLAESFTEATKTPAVPQDVSKSQQIQPGGKAALGPTTSAGRTGAEVGYGPGGAIPQQLPPAMDPKALNDLNLRRPGHIKGNITFEGDDSSSFQFGSGGARSSRGSVPYGVYEIMPGLHQHSKYKSFENNSFYVKDMFDPQVGDTRRGILLHQASDWQNLYTHGCLGIRPDQWQAFKAKMIEYQKNSGGGPVYLSVNPDGSARISSSRPTGPMQFQTSQQVTKDRPELPSGADPGLAAANMSRLPSGLPDGLVKEFSTLSAVEQEKFINQLNAIGSEGIKNLTNFYNQDVTTRPAVKSEKLVEAIQNAPPGQIPKSPDQQAGETIADAAQGKISPTSKAVDEALKMKGLNEFKDRDTIKSFLDKSKRTTLDPSQLPWCSSFVNAAMESSGVKGTGSAMAGSWLNWGERVGRPEDVQKGDVVATTKHVAIATGPAFQDKNGNWIVPTVGGNQSLRGEKGIEWVSETNRQFGGVSIRRARPEDYYEPQSIAEATAPVAPGAPPITDSQAIQPGGEANLGPTNSAGSTGAQVTYTPQTMVPQQAQQETATPLPTPDNPFLGVNFPPDMPQPDINALSPEYRNWASVQSREDLQARIEKGWAETADWKKGFANPGNVASSMNKKFSAGQQELMQSDPEAYNQAVTQTQQKVQQNIEFNKTLQTAPLTATIDPNAGPNKYGGEIKGENIAHFDMSGQKPKFLGTSNPKENHTITKDGIKITPEQRRDAPSEMPAQKPIIGVENSNVNRQEHQINQGTLSESQTKRNQDLRNVSWHMPDNTSSPTMRAHNIGLDGRKSFGTNWNQC